LHGMSPSWVTWALSPGEAMRDPGEEPERKHCQAGLEFPHTERSGSQQLVTPDDATSQKITGAASKGGPGAHITVTLSSQQWDRYLEAAFEFTYMQTCKTDSSLGPASVQRVTKNLVSLPAFCICVLCSGPVCPALTL
jgi:hypothetical protein